MNREVFVVIPVHNRIEMLRELLDAIRHDGRHVILIDNNSTPPLMEVNTGLRTRAIIRRFATRNIQAMWNEGWKVAAEESQGPYAIAFLNSDAMVSTETLIRMVDALDTLDASVVSADHCKILYGDGFIRKTVPGPVQWAHRLSGYGFVVRGELRTRFDEDLVWWYGDDDFEWRAREEFGGSILIGGVHIENRDANGAQRDYPELHIQTDKDRVNFINKWGVSSQDWTVYNPTVYNATLGKYGRVR